MKWSTTDFFNQLLVFDKVIFDKVIFGEVIFGEVIFGKVIFDIVIFNKVIFNKVIFDEVIFGKVIFDEVIFNIVIIPRKNNMKEVLDDDLTKYLISRVTVCARHFCDLSLKLNTFYGKAHKLIFESYTIKLNLSLLKVQWLKYFIKYAKGFFTHKKNSANLLESFKPFETIKRWIPIHTRWKTHFLFQIFLFASNRKLKWFLSISFKPIASLSQKIMQWAPLNGITENVIDWIM